MAGQKTVSRPERGQRRRKPVVKKDRADSNDIPLQCLEQLRLYAAPITGDGNCLFYSLSDQLYGSPDRHDEIRSRLVEHMRNNAEYFMPFVADVGGERRAPRRAAASQSKKMSSVGRTATVEGQRARFDTMLSQMGKLGFWGGSTEIQAFCQAYDRDVIVYTEHGIQTFSSNLAKEDPEREAAHVAYHAWEHYSSVRSKEGPHTGLPSLSRPPSCGLKEETDSSKGKVESDSSTSPMPSSTSSVTLAEPWKIGAIAKALPGFGHDTIRAVLTQCRGDIENAFTRLLDDEPPSSQSSQTLSTTPATSSTQTKSSSAGLPRPGRLGLGSSSRSSSRNSTASKRSANDSDDDDEEGNIRPPIRRHRGRDRKRRILQDVTVGISLRHEDENDVFKIKLRVDPNVMAEKVGDAPNASSASEEAVAATREQQQLSQGPEDDSTEDTISCGTDGDGTPDSGSD